MRTHLCTKMPELPTRQVNNKIGSNEETGQRMHTHMEKWFFFTKILHPMQMGSNKGHV